MRNPIYKFRQSSLAFEKPDFLSENWKLWRDRVQYFLLKLRTRFLLTNVSYCCLDLELLAKIKKDLVSTHLLFTVLLITQDLKKKKNPEHPFVDIVK